MHCGCNAQIRYSWISIHNTLCDDDYCKHAFYFSIFIHWKSAIIIFPLICHEWPAATHRTIRTKFSMCDSELFTICFSFSLFFLKSAKRKQKSRYYTLSVFISSRSIALRISFIICAQVMLIITAVVYCHLILLLCTTFVCTTSFFYYFSFLLCSFFTFFFVLVEPKGTA